jgi:hypothetical protein
MLFCAYTASGAGAPRSSGGTLLLLLLQPNSAAAAAAAAAAKHSHLHLALVSLAHLVALEAVLIPAGFLAQLAVPAQLVQALGLDAVGNLQI